MSHNRHASKCLEKWGRKSKSSETYELNIFQFFLEKKNIRHRGRNVRSSSSLFQGSVYVDKKEQSVVVCAGNSRLGGRESNCSVSHNLFELYPTARHNSGKKSSKLFDSSINLYYYSSEKSMPSMDQRQNFNWKKGFKLVF